jgi:hypothetical protein
MIAIGSRVDMVRVLGRVVTAVRRCDGELLAMSGPRPVAALDDFSGGNSFGAGLRFEIGLVAGHSYRFRVVVHDGDPTRDGDSR